MGLVYLDTNVFIQAFEGELDRARPIMGLFVALQEQPGTLLTSELTLAELLAPVKAHGARSVLEKTELYGSFFRKDLVGLVPVCREILERTATLRLNHPLKLPDAIHVMTAIKTGCRFLVSNDRDIRQLPSSLTHIPPSASGIEGMLKAFRG